MNDMTTALQRAGVPIPTQKQRIWQWLSDNGHHSTKDIASALNIKQDVTQAAITDLRNRQMLSLIPMDNGKGVRLNNHYGALGRKYELLSPHKKGAKKPEPKVVYEPKGEVVVIPEFKPEVFLGKLTLSELRSVHAYLGRFFK
jgi:hypothetical protein